VVKSVLMTGSTGFLGTGLLDALRRVPGLKVTCSARSKSLRPADGDVLVGDISANTDWQEALHGQQIVIHAAARAHVMDDGADDALSLYREVNTDGSLNFARQAATAGVKRFIFISSVKVNGEQTEIERPFSSHDTPSPEDFYGLSKHEAEQGLWELASETGMELVIIRPPLVYGPGVKGNFASMIKLVEKGLPLPLGAIHNKRSLVALDNLVDLIITCIDHPNAANQTFLVSDGEDLSTTELLQGVAEAMGKPSRLIPVPAGLLQFGATLLGKKAMAQRLLGSLQVDISKTESLLGWQPPLSVEEGLKRCFSDQ
jgi:nucleoside-diphosphate-sugar epimerase